MIIYSQIGQAGVSNNVPQWLYLETNDTYAAVTATGYLTSFAQQNFNSLKTNMVALVSTKTAPNPAIAPVVYFFSVSSNNGVWSLLPQPLPSPFIIPGNLTVNGNIQGGNYFAGTSAGAAGGYRSYPGGASSGHIDLAATTNAAGDFSVLVTNALSISQNQTIRIPDCGAGSANFLLSEGVNNLGVSGRITPNKVDGTEAANLVTANGMAGKITTSALTTAGGGSYVITWVNSFIPSSNFVPILTLGGGTNTNKNITIQCVPITGNATITIYNNSGSALNGTIVLNYLVM